MMAKIYYLKSHKICKPDFLGKLEEVREVSVFQQLIAPYVSNKARIVTKHCLVIFQSTTWWCT